MAISCEELKEAMRSFSLIQSCDVTKDGALRIATPFCYPDGSHIDVFLEPLHGLIPGYSLSDGGQTVDYVSDLNFELFTTKKRRLLIDDICNSLGVYQHDGSFQVVLKPEEIADTSDAIVRLSQACIRITDLIYTQRLQVPGSFQDEVEEFLAVTHLDYEPDYLVESEYGGTVKIDFRVRGSSLTSLVQTLSSRVNGHVAANEKLSRWVGIESLKRANQFLTVYDETSGGFYESDLKKLAKYSTVVRFPKEQEEFYAMLAA